MPRCGAQRLRIGLTLAAVSGLEAVAILGPAGLGRPPILGGDGPGYHRLAVNLLDHGWFSLSGSSPYEPTVIRTPGYPAFLAAVYSIAGRSPLGVRVTQFALLWGTACLVYCVARPRLGYRAALVGSLLCACYPPFLFMAGYHLTETLATFLAVLFVLLLEIAANDGARTMGAWASLALGTVVGVAALVRPSMAPLAAIAMAWLLGAPRRMPPTRRLTLAVLAAAAAAVCVLPWSVRNYAVSGRIIPLAAASGWSRYVSVSQYAGRISYAIRVKEWGLINADAARREQEAMAAVASNREAVAEPTAPDSVRIECLVDRSYERDAAALFQRLSISDILRSLPVRVAYLWSTGDMAPRPSAWLHRGTQMLHAALACCAVLGLWSLHRDLRTIALFLLLPAYFTLLHLVYHVESRYTFPARPFVLVLAGVALGSRSRSRSRSNIAQGPQESSIAALSRPDAVSVDLTVTVVSWNTRDLLRDCLESLRGGCGGQRVEVHVIDNASDDGSAEMVREQFPEVRLTANHENVGFARANNQSWREARGRYWLLLNSDTRVRPGALDRLVAFLEERPRAGLVTARLVNPDGTPQHCAQPLPAVGRTLFEALRLHKCLPAPCRGRFLLGPYWTYDRPLRIGWTWGTALLARRQAVQQAGPLAEDFFMYGEDLEWCLRMRRHGWETWFCPEAQVLHLGGQSSAQRWDEAGRTEMILDGVYRAVQLDRGRFSVRMLQAATLGALSIEWAAARIRGRRRDRLSALIRYQLASLAAQRSRRTP
jgi:GT2 family glycosyltransferase/4-amino-4-deoxy-L-arabinose transferase-like glycosyltransferase